MAVRSRIFIHVLCFNCSGNFLWNISCIPYRIVTQVVRGNECFREFEIATDSVTSYTLGRSFVRAENSPSYPLFQKVCTIGCFTAMQL